MKASDIIKKARFTLSDTDKFRWSDERLLSLLNDAIYDIAVTTDLYKSIGYVKLTPKKRIYDLSEYALNINRVEHNNKNLKKLSFDDMDKAYGKSWQIKININPEAIVYDLYIAGQFRLYPLYEDGLGEHIESNSSYGIITDITYDPLHIIYTSDSFGDLNPPDFSKYLKIYFTKIPKEIKNISDDLDKVIDKTMFNCLSHYIVGVALKDNMDTRNAEIGNQELALFEAKKTKRENEQFKSNVKRNYSVEYKGEM